MSLHEQSSRYHVEVLTKLKLLKVFIWCKASDKIRIGCKKGESEDALFLVLFRDRIESVEQISINVMPSISIDISTSQVVIREDLTTCSFEIQFKDDFSRYIWQYGQENADVQSLSDLKSLSCYHCSQPILRQPSKIEKITVLPTEHWEDMREFWTCACTANLFENRLPRSTIVHSLPHTVQIASSHLQLHYDDLEVQSLFVDPEEPHTVAFHRNWKNLWCVRCGSLLGQAEMPSVDNSHHLHHSTTSHSHHHEIEAHKTDSSVCTQHHDHHEAHSEEKIDKLINEIIFRNVKLDKHMIKTDTINFSNHRLETKVCSDILAAISISGSPKILLRDYRTRRPAIILTVLGWDSLIFSSSVTLQPVKAEYNSLMPSLRLLYSVLDTEASPPPMSDFEILEYDKISLLHLSTLLTLRNSLLPPIISRLGTQSVSYLLYTPPMDISKHPS